MDRDILRQLEEEIGREIPVVSLEKEIPKEYGGGGHVNFQSFFHGPSYGAFADERGRIVGLALCGMGLPSFPKTVFKLRHLRRINLGENHIRRIPSDISRWRHLEVLQLYGNRVEQVPERLFRLGVEISTGTVNAGIFLGENPIVSPPMEIMDRGLQSVLSYFASIRSEAMPLNEAKVLLVGDGGAGKTCLVKRMLGAGFDENERQTDGINIESWEQAVDGKTIRLNIWDFGGQEIMHATHQFFLSERSLYVLVLDGRKEEDPEYWLKHIRSFGGDSPVLIVLNKMDENPGYDLNRRFLSRKYSNVLGFYRVACSTGEGVDEFLDAFRSSLDRVQITKTTWPTAWFRVKTQLCSMNEPFISYEHYLALCEEEGVLAGEGAGTLVQFLHDLGVVVHFADFQLQDTHVLDPQWLTGAVYRIINSPELAASSGVLKLSSLPDILSGGDAPGGYPVDRHPYIINVMQKFEICYQIDQRTILVPDLLPIQEPEIVFDYEGCIAIRVDYEFLPKSVLPRFIVKMHGNIADDLRWRTGVVLCDSSLNTTAIVRADEASKCVYVYVAGDHPRDFMTVIRSTLLGINRSFEKLGFQERIPLPDNPEVTVSYDHLLRLEKEGIRTDYPDGAAHCYDVQELLGTISIASTYTEKEFIEMVRMILHESDTPEQAVDKANSILILQPNFLGLGLNINEIVKRASGRGKR